MNRCFSAPRRLALLGLALAPWLATAQTLRSRPFPASALRASFVVTQAPDILLNGKVDRLSPGARIYGQNNLLVMPATLTGQNLLVHYVREPNGMVHEVWILTQAEADVPRAGMSNWN